MLKGKQSWLFDNHPVIQSTGVAGGPFEGNGNLAKDFDILHEDLWMGKTSYEQAHRVLLEEATETALKKADCLQRMPNFLLQATLSIKSHQPALLPVT